MIVRAKYIKNNYLCFSAGYCDIQTISKGAVKIGACAGVYGWNCDIFGTRTLNAVIVSGYRPFGYSSRRTQEIMKRYEAEAREKEEKNYYSLDPFLRDRDFYEMLRELIAAWREETQK